MKPLNKIFWKVFFLILAALVIMSIVSYVLIYLLLPDFYKKYEIQQYEYIVQEVVKEINDTNDLNREVEIITTFAHKYGVDAILYDSANNIVFDYFQTKYIVSDINNSGDYNSIEMTGEMTGFADDRTSLFTSYELLGEKRKLEVIIPLEPLDEAKSVIIDIYPIAFAGCIVFALVVAFVFSNLFAKPIKKLNASVRRMSEMEPDAYIEVKSSDEIGELGGNVNLLYSELKGTIDSLNMEILKSQDAENQKIDFLRTVSHELKNPLAAANSLIEGLIYEVPPYDANQKEYLLQCKEFLEKAIELARESLQFSKNEYKEETALCSLKEVLASVISEYRIIISSKQIEYVEEISEKQMVHTKIMLFSKALSNIFSNAVNYTSYKGRVRVYMEKANTESGVKDVLIIENSCEPILEDKLKELFKKPYIPSPCNHISTGLGLYIVNQLLNMLHMDYRFVSTKNPDGMRFEIDINTDVNNQKAKK